MVKIVIPQPFIISDSDMDKLKSLAEVVAYDDLASTTDEWVQRCKGADIVCTGKFGLKEKYQELENVYISLPFVGVGFFDQKILKERNIKVSNSPGCNKDAVAEWIIFSLLNVLRGFHRYIDVDSLQGKQEISKGLNTRKVTILGKGNIGSKVGRVCEALDMEVSYFTRKDDLLSSIQDADAVVNCLTTNPSTEALLDKNFFNSFKKGAVFVNVCDYVIYDVDALIEALDNGLIAGAAIDAMGIHVENTADPFYRKILAHPKILASPHIAWNSDISNALGKKIMIENIEAWLEGKPKNLI